MFKFVEITFVGGGHGYSQKKIMGGGARAASQNSYPISDQNLWFSLLYYLWSYQKFDTHTVALNMMFEGLLLVVLSIMIKK